MTKQVVPLTPTQFVEAKRASFMSAELLRYNLANGARITQGSVILSERASK